MKRWIAALLIAACFVVPTVANAGLPGIVMKTVAVPWDIHRAAVAATDWDSTQATHAGARTDTTAWFGCPGIVSAAAIADSLPLMTFKFVQSSNLASGSSVLVTPASGTTTFQLQVTYDALGTPYTLPEFAAAVTITARGTGNYVLPFVPTTLGNTWAGAKQFRWIVVSAGSGQWVCEATYPRLAIQ